MSICNLGILLSLERDFQRQLVIFLGSKIRLYIYIYIYIYTALSCERHSAKNFFQKNIFFVERPVESGNLSNKCVSHYRCRVGTTWVRVRLLGTNQATTKSFDEIVSCELRVFHTIIWRKCRTRFFLAVQQLLSWPFKQL